MSFPEDDTYIKTLDYDELERRFDIHKYYPSYFHNDEFLTPQIRELIGDKPVYARANENEKMYKNTGVWDSFVTERDVKKVREKKSKEDKKREKEQSKREKMEAKRELKDARKQQRDIRKEKHHDYEHIEHQSRCKIEHNLVYKMAETRRQHQDIEDQSNVSAKHSPGTEEKRGPAESGRVKDGNDVFNGSGADTRVAGNDSVIVNGTVAGNGIVNRNGVGTTGNGTSTIINGGTMSKFEVTGNASNNDDSGEICTVPEGKETLIFTNPFDLASTLVPTQRLEATKARQNSVRPIESVTSERTRTSLSGRLRHMIHWRNTDSDDSLLRRGSYDQTLLTMTSSRSTKNKLLRLKDDNGRRMSAQIGTYI